MINLCTFHTPFPQVWYQNTEQLHRLQSPKVAAKLTPQEQDINAQDELR